MMYRALFAAILVALTPYALANNQGQYAHSAITYHDLTKMPVAGLPTPRILITQIIFSPTKTSLSSNTALSPVKTTPLPVKTIAQTALNDGKVLDVTLIDDFIDDVTPNVLHYPPNFPNRTAQYHTGQNIKHFANWLDPYAKQPNASTDILMLAATINLMGKNMDLGSDFGVRAHTYLNALLKKDPNHANANYLYGVMLSEAGGFSEGQRYLQIAADQGLVEAEQSLAQVELLTDNTDAALSRLKALQARHPNNAQINKQITIIQNGGYYIWDIEDTDIHVKPVER